jgi:hypothetical protein
MKVNSLIWLLLCEIILIYIFIISMAKVGQHRHQERLLVALTVLERPAQSNTSDLGVPSVDCCLQVEAHCSSTLM